MDGEEARLAAREWIEGADPCQRCLPELVNDEVACIWRFSSFSLFWPFCELESRGSR